MKKSINALLQPVQTYFDVTVREPIETLQHRAKESARPEILKQTSPTYLIKVAKKQRKAISPEFSPFVNVCFGTSSANMRSLPRH